MSIKQAILGHLTAPHTMVDFHFWALVFWTVMIVPTVLWLGSSVIYVSLISVYAIIVSHQAALSATRAEEAVTENE